LWNKDCRNVPQQGGSNNQAQPQGNTTAGTIDKALDDINTLRISRYDTRNSVYQPIQINDVNALWAFYKDERRRELCLEEGHRWFDIRRWRLPVHHKYIDILDQVTEVDLTAGDLLYALPIPYPAMDNNNSLVPNPR
jgi:starch-binding outer membrane protein, SusD/RagB family